MSFSRKKTKETYFQDRVITKAPSTREGIKHSLNNFEKFCIKSLGQKNMEQVIQKILKLKQEKREEKAFDILQQWISWNSTMVNPSTIRIYCSGITRYLNYRGIKLTQQEIKEQLDLPRKIVEEKTPLTREILQHVIKASHFSKVSLYLALLSSGMRIGEAVSIRKENLEFVDSIKGRRALVKIPAKFSKNGIGRSVFISKEAYRHVEAKLKTLKDNQLVWGVNENRKKATAAEEKAFSRCLERIGRNERLETTGRHKISLHSLRAYFFTRAAKIDQNFAQIMLGHSGYLVREYDQRTQEDKLETYLKVEPDLVIDNIEFLKSRAEKLERENFIANKAVIQIGSKLRRTDTKVERLLKGMTEINPEYGKILEIRKNGPY